MTGKRRPLARLSSDDSTANWGDDGFHGRRAGHLNSACSTWVAIANGSRAPRAGRRPATHCTANVRPRRHLQGGASPSPSATALGRKPSRRRCAGMLARIVRRQCPRRLRTRGAHQSFRIISPSAGGDGASPYRLGLGRTVMQSTVKGITLTTAVVSALMSPAAWGVTAAEVSAMCDRCHGLSVNGVVVASGPGSFGFTAYVSGRDQITWTNTVARMVAHGAVVSDPNGTRPPMMGTRSPIVAIVGAATRQQPTNLGDLPAVGLAHALHRLVRPAARCEIGSRDT